MTQVQQGGLKDLPAADPAYIAVQDGIQLLKAAGGPVENQNPTHHIAFMPPIVSSLLRKVKDDLN
jgi:ABC-type Zn uptake system ZnuABC Zn-binding protein ZnuA